MPATIEALFIVLVFVMPGFVTLRVKDFFVPSGTKPEPLQTTLHSITMSLFYLPVWLISLPTLLAVRSQLLSVAAAPGSQGVLPMITWNISALALFHSLLLPATVGGLWAIAIWNDWPNRIARRFYRRLNIPLPPPGVGDNLWDRLWLNRRHKPWLTVFMKDGRIYVGKGVEFALASEAREVLLGGDTKQYDGDWNLVRNLGEARGEAVWVPVTEVSSIEVHE